MYVILTRISVKKPPTHPLCPFSDQSMPANKSRKSVCLLSWTSWSFPNHYKHTLEAHYTCASFSFYKSPSPVGFVELVLFVLAVLLAQQLWLALSFLSLRPESAHHEPFCTTIFLVISMFSSFSRFELDYNINFSTNHLKFFGVPKCSKQAFICSAFGFVACSWPLGPVQLGLPVSHHTTVKVYCVKLAE